MTKDDLNDNWNVVEALKEGKEIQVFNFSTNEWVDTTYLDLSSNIYRVKPSYIPFSYDQKGFLKGKWIKRNHPDAHSEYMITFINRNGVGVHSWGYDISYEELYKEFVFSDGSPCGLLNKQ